MSSILASLFPSRNQRLLKRYQARVLKINALEEQMQAASDQELQEKMADFRNKVTSGTSLDTIANEVFAIVREASRRTLGMRHFDVQLIGGMALHDGKIGEMRTGEGKTLTATLPAALNALHGKGVHIVTVNDYLATRDSAWMGKLYEFLGFTVSALTSHLNDEQRQQAYQSDILYAVNNELGFDYLRDNMKFFKEHITMRPFVYAIIDEVDSILIDEARTPLIISGQTNEPSELYKTANQLVPQFTRQESEEESGDYFVDEKSKRVYLSETGHTKAEQLYRNAGLLPKNENLYYHQHLHLIHHLESALNAHAVFQKDTDYVVQNDRIILVDEFTGRLMTGRRLSHGLHQAIEAKEKVAILPNSQTLASITFQNFFRNYPKLAGMTGTAATEAQELIEIYNLEVVIIPPNQPMIRKDYPDQVFLDKESKYQAIMEEVKECTTRGQPVLLGTASIEVSEVLSQSLAKNDIRHEVLNAKKHDREAAIIAQAGRKHAVTIATNMAGRGTDIILGGNPSYSEKGDLQPEGAADPDWHKQHLEVIELGGLHVIGTERHESRRVDNQLRGRSGRQGDPGSSRFYLSLDDNLLRIFASENVTKIMQWAGFEAGESIEHPMLSRTIESAQRKVEAHNFQLRKNLIEYDTIANDQRKIVYQQRDRLLNEEDLTDSAKEMIDGMIDNLLERHAPEEAPMAEWSLQTLEQELEKLFFIKISFSEIAENDESLSVRTILENIFNGELSRKREMFGPEHFQSLLRQIMLSILDKHWKQHLVNLEELMRGIHLRGYAAKNPKMEYKREAFELFVAMLDQVRQEIVGTIMQPIIKEEKLPEVHEKDLTLLHKEAPQPTNNPESAILQNNPPTTPQKTKPISAGQRLGRNDPCHCGSGLKYKKCHGKNQ